MARSTLAIGFESGDRRPLRPWTFGRTSPRRRSRSPAVIALLLLGSGPSIATVLETRPSGRCLYRVAATDRPGQRVLEGIAYSLDRPGVLVAPLDRFASPHARWETLQVVSEGRPEFAEAGGPFAVTAVLDVDPTRNLVLLLAPGVDACACDRPGNEVPAEAGDPPSVERTSEALDGFREPLGYVPASFRATLDHRIAMAGGPDLLLVRLPDGRGADSGVILDRRGRIIGSILPPPAGADPGLAVAAAVDDLDLARLTSGPGAEPAGALSAAARLLPGDSAVRDLASALVLTRPEQIDRAEELLAKVAATRGEFAGLLVERGVLRFKAGRIEPAIRDFSRASEIAPTLALARYNLGMALGSAGRFDEAAGSLRDALRVDPGYSRARYQLVLALKAARRTQEAREEYERLLVASPSLALDLSRLLGY